MRTLSIFQDDNGTHLTNIVAPSDNINFLSLSPNVPKTMNVPAEAGYVIFQSFNEFFVSINDTAAVPSDDITDGTGSIPVPLGLAVRTGDAISVVTSESNARVALIFYKRG